MKSALLSECERRDTLAKIIDALLRAWIYKDSSPQRRVRRGIIHRLIGEAIGVRLECRLRRLVNDRMRAQGYTPSFFQGWSYFKYARLRPEVYERLTDREKRKAFGNACRVP